MGRKKHRSQLDAIDEINMTPLIDLTFLLLIIFMITTPLMENSVDVSPPEMNASKMPKTKSYAINLNRDGEIIFNRQAISRDELRLRLDEIKRRSPQTAILIRADGSRPYREVMELMKIAKAAGLNNISLVTIAEGR